MADSPLAFALKFVDATVAARKETSAIEEITSSIVSKYKELTGTVGIVGKLFQKRTAGLFEEKTALYESSKRLNEQIKSRQIENEKLASTLKLVEAIQMQIVGAGKKKKPKLVSQLEDARMEATRLSESIDRTTGTIDAMTEFTIPAARAMDAMAAAQKSWNSNLGVKAITHAIKMSGEFNRSLINANSSIEVRNKLLETGLKVATETGARAQTMLEAQRALVHLGLDLSTAYEDTLKTVVKLIDGLGMSTDEATGLAITARSTNVHFKDMSNTIAGIVDKTSLAADEAARYARELAVAARVSAGTMSSHGSASYVKNLGALAQVESALKGTMAVQGEMAAMLSSFSSFQKKGGMGMFAGTGGIDFLARDEKAAARVMKNVASAVKGSSGIMLEIQAEIYGVSAQTLSELSKKYGELGDKIFEISPEQKEREDFERRYTEQLAQESQAYRLLGDKFKYLVTGALSPLVKMINTVASGIIWAVDKFRDIKVIAVPAMILVTGAVINSVAKMTASLYRFVAATISLTTALNARFGAAGGAKSAAAAVGTEAVGTGLMDWLSKTFKSGAVKAGAETAGGTAVRGLLGRIFGGIGSMFAGSAFRALIGRGIALVGSAFLTGGMSLLIGLVVTLVAQFWPNLVSLFKGKGWSVKQAGIGGEKAAGTGEFAKMIPVWIDKLKEKGAKGDMWGMHEVIKSAYSENQLKLKDASMEDVNRFNEEARRVLDMHVRAYEGYTSRHGVVDPTSTREMLEVLGKMLTAQDASNVTLNKMVTQKESQVKEERERAEKERVENDRKEAIRNSYRVLANEALSQSL